VGQDLPEKVTPAVRRGAIGLTVREDFVADRFGKRLNYLTPSLPEGGKRIGISGRTLAPRLIAVSGADEQKRMIGLAARTTLLYQQWANVAHVAQEGLPKHVAYGVDRQPIEDR